MQKRIYMDNAASTRLDAQVLSAMHPYWGEIYGNPGAIHREGIEARKAIEDSRSVVAKFLGGHKDEIIFTSGGTESNAIAIFGIIKKYEREKNYDVSGLHLMTSTIEHSSVLDGFRELEERGAKVDYIGVNKDGFFDLEQIKDVLTAETFLVSLMYVNNEIGVIEPIEEIGKLIREVRSKSSGRQPFFHSDASQACAWLKINVEKCCLDLASIDAQKINGPKGSGALYIRKGTPITNPLFTGGRQEMGLRPGTEPTPLIVGLSKACEIVGEEREGLSVQVASLRDYFIDQLLDKIPGIELNGSRENRLPNNVNVSISGFESEYLILALDSKGIACAARSACLADNDGSYVVSALGKDRSSAISALRFSLGKETTKTDIDYVVSQLVNITNRP